MSVHIDRDGRLHQDRDATLALTCPHCQVLAQITPILTALPRNATGKVLKTELRKAL